MCEVGSTYLDRKDFSNQQVHGPIMSIPVQLHMQSIVQSIGCENLMTKLHSRWPSVTL